MRRGPFFTALGVTALVVMTSACSSGATEAASETAEAETPDSMTFVAYGGVTQDVMRDQWLDPWGEKHGVTVVQDSPTDYAKLVSMVEAGNPTWDLVDTEPFFPIQECGTVVQELDLSNIDESKLPAGTVSECAVPLWGYSLLLVYNPTCTRTTRPRRSLTSSTWTDSRVPDSLRLMRRRDPSRSPCLRTESLLTSSTRSTLTARLRSGTNSAAARRSGALRQRASRPSNPAAPTWRSSGRAARPKRP